MPLQFDLVSPERRLLSVEAQEVQIPGASGDLTAMEGHSPAITTLRPGIVRASVAGGEKSYVVTGGFAEISATAITILAERAVAVEDIDAQMFDSMIHDLQEAIIIAEDKDLAQKSVTDLQDVRQRIGRSA